VVLGAMLARKLLKEQAVAAATALAYWAWNNREEVVDWTAYGVRAIQNTLAGNTDDVVTEARLRFAILGDRRARRAIGLEVRVKDGVAILTGLVDPGARELALRLAEKTEGVREVDDRMEVLHARPEVGPAV
jgi:osmotically-inducible protein OsmY